MAGFHGVDLTGHEHIVYLTYFSRVVLSLKQKIPGTEKGITVCLQFLGGRFLVFTRHIQKKCLDKALS